MPQIDIYAPFSGEVWSTDCYCHWDSCNKQPPCGGAGCTHEPVASGYLYPMDIGDPDLEGWIVRFYASSGVDHIQIEYFNDVCGVDPDPWTWGIIVHMFDLNDFGLGSVLYGHLRNREGYVTNGQVIYNPSGTALGEVPQLCPSCVSCYSGTHVHMEIVSGGSAGPYKCDNRVYAGSSVVYTYSY